MDTLPILSGLWFKGTVLWLEWRRVPILLKLSEDVARHGYVQRPVVMIPFEIDNAVQLMFTVFLYFIDLGESLPKMLGVLMSNVFNAKIIDHMHELDETADMPS